MTNLAIAHRARAAAAGAQTMAQVAFWVIVATLAVNYGVSTIRMIAGLAGAPASEWMSTLGLHALSVLPAIFYLSALARLQRALHEYEQGRFFSPASARAVRKAGEDGVYGLVAQILIVPAITGWVRREAPFATKFELVDLALLALLAFIAVVGRVLDIAVAVKAENDQIV